MLKPEDLTAKDLANVHKFVYLAREYNKESVADIGNMFGMSMLDINAVIYRTRDLGYLVINDETREYTVDRVPDEWNFGEDVSNLMDTFIYVMGKLNEQEHDLEDQDLGNWTAGHITHDVAVAMKRLIELKQISTYELTTRNEAPVSKKARGRGKTGKVEESTYVFYTLYENLEQQFGRKRFPNKDKLVN